MKSETVIDKALTDMIERNIISPEAEWYVRPYLEIVGAIFYKEGTTNLFYSRKKEVVQYDLNGKHIRDFKSLSEAERITGTRHGNISQVCLGNRKKAGGSIWKYKMF